MEEILVQEYGDHIETMFEAKNESSDSLSSSGSNQNIHKPQSVSSLVYFEYRCIKFLLDPMKDLFVDATDIIHYDNFHSLESITSGRSNNDDILRRRALYGPNEINIKEKSTLQLLVDEVLHPFNVFQMFSILLWSFDNYYLYASCIFIITAASAMTTLYETKASITTLKNLSRFVCKLRVKRDEKWIVIESRDLVPGDVFEIEDTLVLMPCDAILLSGEVIMNESMLTGESIPVSKSPMPNFVSLKEAESSKALMFNGTRIVRAKPNSLAFCYRTGFSTTKGLLIRSMLFPKPHTFKFYADSFKFVGLLAVIAVAGFLVSCYFFVKNNIPSSVIFKRALDLFTIVVPPALPATMSIGTSFAISRLKREMIFCISPNRVNIGGKLNAFVFDKTGTLTEEGLSVLGVRENENGSFTPLLTTVSTKDEICLAHAMATCHSIKCVNEKLLGDPLELKMFEFTDWLLEEIDDSENPLVSVVVRPKGANPDLNSVLQGGTSNEIGIIRSFDFDSKLRRMTVMSKKLCGRSIEVYSKGSPEGMKKICRPESLPSDFDKLLDHYAHRGYRILACAGKKIEISWIESQKMSREDAESDLQFLGFIVFENKLKERTVDIIKKLSNARFRNIMCTGDNILTAISVSRECGLVNSSTLFYPKLTGAELEWKCLDNEDWKLNPVTLKPFNSKGETLRDYELACTGNVYEHIQENYSEDTLNYLLVGCQIFARMSPDQKHHLVENLQSLGYYVGFCGDGANDCGALKSADVGVSLSSEAEASVAAPFTSQITDIGCTISIIKEGRASLVTSFSCFKYIAMYSIIQFTSVTILYTFMSSLSDYQFLYIDLLLIFPMALVMGRFKAYDEIAAKRPTANLLSRKVVISLLGHMAIQVIFQIVLLGITTSQSWFERPQYDGRDTNTFNTLNSSLFLFSIFQYIFTGLVFVVGKPYQQALHENFTFVAMVLIATLVNLYLLLVASDSVLEIMSLEVLPYSHRWTILLLVVLSLVTMFVSERYLFPSLAKAIKSLKKRSFDYESQIDDSLSAKKPYKRLLRLYNK